jgi:thiol-disulfide isomerase/thioredoxin/outer membrane lipoprotein-sorting protein
MPMRYAFSRVLWFLFLESFACLNCAVSPRQSGIDPAALLQSISQKYGAAKHYHIETQLSESWKSEHSSRWEESSQKAIVGADGRYRFEADGPHYAWVQVSNGATEWVYNAKTQEYAERQTTANGKPSQFDANGWSSDESALIDSQDILSDLVDLISLLRNPVFAGSEVLSLGTSSVDCYLIRGQGRYRSGWSPDTQLDVTLWIDKSALTIRKIEQDWQGPLSVRDPTRYTRTNITVFPVVAFTDQHAPLSLFEFEVPPPAKLVAKFATMQGPPVRRTPSLVGSIAPEVNFESTNGQSVSLTSFRGKPVLIEFWATWCGPCVAALPMLERLYAAAQAHGVVVITVDEDETAEKASKYLAAHRNATWPNYHDDGEINRKLPGDGLPQFVLISASGKIAFATTGVDEKEIRAALAQLGFDIETSVRQGNTTNSLR